MSEKLKSPTTAGERATAPSKFFQHQLPPGIPKLPSANKEGHDDAMAMEGGDMSDLSASQTTSSSTSSGGSYYATLLNRYYSSVSVNECAIVCQHLIECSVQQYKQRMEFPDGLVSNDMAQALLFSGDIQSAARDRFWSTRKTLLHTTIGALNQLVATLANAHLTHANVAKVAGFTRLNTLGTYVNQSVGFLVHIWNSCGEARRYINATQHGWNTLASHSIRQVHVPFSLLFGYRGYLITATALLPLAEPEPIDFAGKRNEETTTCLKSSVKRFSIALCANLFPTPHELKVHRGGDGRYYVVDVEPLMPMRVDRPPSGDWSWSLRPEAYATVLQTVVDPAAQHDDITSAVAQTSLAQEVARRVTHFVEKTQKGDVTEILRKSLLSGVFHRSGLNLRYINRVYLAVDPKSTITRSCLAWEMMIRTIKDVIRADFRSSRTDTAEQAADRVNRLMQLTMQRKTGVWDDHLTPLVRMKYACAKNFVVELNSAFIKHITSRLTNSYGFVFETSKMRFTKFTSQAKCFGCFGLLPELQSVVGGRWANADAAALNEEPPAGENSAAADAANSGEEDADDFLARSQRTRKQSSVVTADMSTAVFLSPLRRKPTVGMKGDLSLSSSSSQLQNRGTLARSSSTVADVIKQCRGEGSSANDASSVCSALVDAIHEQFFGASEGDLLDSEVHSFTNQIMFLTMYITAAKPSESSAKRAVEIVGTFIAVSIEQNYVDTKPEWLECCVALAVAWKTLTELAQASDVLYRLLLPRMTHKQDQWCASEIVTQQSDGALAKLLDGFQKARRCTWVDGSINSNVYNLLLRIGMTANVSNDGRVVREALTLAVRWATWFAPSTRRERCLAAVRKMNSNLILSQNAESCRLLKAVSLEALRMHEKTFGPESVQTTVALSQMVYISANAHVAELSSAHLKELRTFQAQVLGFGSLSVKQVHQLCHGKQYATSLGVMAAALTAVDETAASERAMFYSTRYARNASKLKQYEAAKDGKRMTLEQIQAEEDAAEEEHQEEEEEADEEEEEADQQLNTASTEEQQPQAENNSSQSAMKGKKKAKSKATSQGENPLGTERNASNNNSRSNFDDGGSPLLPRGSKKMMKNWQMVQKGALEKIKAMIRIKRESQAHSPSSAVMNEPYHRLGVRIVEQDAIMLAFNEITLEAEFAFRCDIISKEKQERKELSRFIDKQRRSHRLERMTAFKNTVLFKRVVIRPYIGKLVSEALPELETLHRARLVEFEELCRESAIKQIENQAVEQSALQDAEQAQRHRIAESELEQLSAILYSAGVAYGPCTSRLFSKALAAADVASSQADDVPVSLPTKERLAAVGAGTAPKAVRERLLQLMEKVYDEEEGNGEAHHQSDVYLHVCQKLGMTPMHSVAASCFVAAGSSSSGADGNADSDGAAVIVDTRRAYPPRKHWDAILMTCAVLLRLHKLRGVVMAASQLDDRQGQELCFALEMVVVCNDGEVGKSNENKKTSHLCSLLRYIDVSRNPSVGVQTARALISLLKRCDSIVRAEVIGTMMFETHKKTISSLVSK